MKLLSKSITEKIKEDISLKSHLGYVLKRTTRAIDKMAERNDITLTSYSALEVIKEHLKVEKVESILIDA